jgi:ketosteroid isomerase-like protein
VNERDAFLDATMPRQIEADTALHNGDVGPRVAMWSNNDPVTLFGAWLSATGWDNVSKVFQHLATVMENCESFEFELVAAGASGDLAYTVAYEHTTATINGVPSTYTLPATHVYRRENGEWKVVHRHADRMPDEPNVI